MKTAKLLIFVALAALTAHNAFAAQAASGTNLDIAAVVGEEAISSYDVENRIKFIIATTKLSGTQDVLERIRPQVLRALVDERLQLQEAAKYSINISEDDINNAIAGIEKQRGMPQGGIFAILQKNNVPKETFTTQIHAQLAWNKLVMKNLRPLVKISDEEVKLARGQIAAPTKINEIKIAVFTLPVDKAARENEIKKLADKLVREIRAGASFEEVTRQFSGSSGRGGGTPEPFWIRPSQLHPIISKALSSPKPDAITDPVRTETGYNIVKIYDMRVQDKAVEKEMEITLKEILLRLKPEATSKEANVLLQIGEDVAKHPGTCEEKGLAGMDNLKDFDIEVNFKTDMLSQLPQALRIISENLKQGDISTPFASSEGIRLYMLCGKKDITESPANDDRIREMIYAQKMELEAQKYMRNLRRDGFVEVR